MRKIVNPSSADLAHAMPNVTHVANINPNVAHIAPDVTHVAHISPHEARETSVIAPYVNNVNLNTQYMYIILFKNLCDQQQVAHLARQMYPNKSHSFLDVFRYATKEPYGYLLVDLKQDTADEDRLRTNIIKGVGKCKMPHLTSVIFASTMDLQKHVKRGCPENDEPPMKRLCDENTDEPDESGWDNIMQRVYRKYYDQYSEKVESYEKEGYSEVESREKPQKTYFGSTEMVL